MSDSLSEGEPGSKEPSDGSRDSENPQQKMHAMLAGIWERSRKNITERGEVLRECRELALRNALDESARLRAVDAAHKLAGVLGTFGLPRGTELAREAEEIFSGERRLSQAAIERLDPLLKELDGLIRTENPSLRSKP